MKLPDAERPLAALVDQMRGNVTAETALVGIHTGGVWIAERLHRELGIAVPLGTLDVSFYRDDFDTAGLHRNVKRSEIPFAVEDRDIVLVDDVLFTGTFFFPVGEEIREIVAAWVSYLRDEKLWGNDDPPFPATHIAAVSFLLSEPARAPEALQQTVTSTRGKLLNIAILCSRGLRVVHSPVGDRVSPRFGLVSRTSTLPENHDESALRGGPRITG